MQQRRNTIVSLLLFMYAVYVCGQLCGNPNPSVDQIDSGKHLCKSGRLTLVRRGGARQHCFTVPINYNIPNTGRSPDIAVSIIRIQGFNTNGGFDYSVSANRKGLTNSIGVNVQISQDARWASLQISYIVNSNTNFIVSSFIANMASLTSCVNDFNVQSVNAETYVPTYRINQNLSYKVVSFISGFRTIDNSFLLRISSADIDKIDGRVIVQIQSNASPGLQYVYINYVVYSTTITNNIQFILTSNINQASTYKLQGLLSVQQNNQLQYSQLIICNKANIIQCPQNQTLRNNKCQCNQGFIKVGQDCKQMCMANGYFNENRICVCVQGYQRNQQGMCVQASRLCRQNQYFQNGIGCTCVPGFGRNQQGICILNNQQCNGPNQVRLSNGQCGCVFGFYRNGNTCLSICTGQNQVWKGNSCDCAPGYIKYTPNQPCLPMINCPVNQVLQGNSCACVTGFIRNQNGLCITCSNLQTIVGGSCQCINGYNRNPMGICIPVIQICGIDQIYNTNTRQCQCKDGFLRVGSTCVNRCGINSQWKNNRCACVTGTAFVRGVCRPCPRGSQPDSNSQTCICSGNFIFKSDTNDLSCAACPVGSNAINNECICNSGFQWNSDKSACIQVAITQCPANSTLGSDGKCNCNPGYRWTSDNKNCEVACSPNTYYDNIQRRCVCSPNYEWNALNGACTLKPSFNCPPNSNRNINGGCSCIQNYRWNPQGTACIPPCPFNSFPDGSGNCVCINGYTLSPDGLACIVSTPIQNCPANSSPDSRRICNCNSGYRWAPDGLSCLVIPTINCPPNSIASSNGACICANGYYFESPSSTQCKQIPTCPMNSQWDQSKLQCICTIPNQFLINNMCISCKVNEFWNGRECVCNTGMYKIGGICKVCDINSSYNGTDCICNIGYFGNSNNICNKCHSSCGRCNGTQPNNCITCIDITYNYANSFCTQNTPCPIGNYLNGSSCAKCSDYCQVCVNQLECGQCAPGFTIALTIIDGVGYSACMGVCGDGRRVDIQQCDDNNTVSGDGCSSTCTFQDGWSCSGGTSISPSICIKSTTTRSILQVKGSVNSIGKVIQGVRLSYIPKCFTDNDCIDCFKIIEAKVIQGDLPVSVTVSYIPNSNGQFLVQYNFGGIITSTAFTYMVQISQNLPTQYKSCFSAADYAQQIVNKIDTATLALNDKTSLLSLDDLLTSSTTTSGVSITSTTSSSGNDTILGYPKKIIDKIFM